MARIPTHRIGRTTWRPNAWPFFELRTPRGWWIEQTAHAFLVTAETVASWMRRVDEQGDAPGISPRTRQKVPRFRPRNGPEAENAQSDRDYQEAVRRKTAGRSGEFFEDQDPVRGYEQFFEYAGAGNKAGPPGSCPIAGRRTDDRFRWCCHRNAGGPPSPTQSVFLTL